MRPGLCVSMVGGDGWVSSCALEFHARLRVWLPGSLSIMEGAGTQRSLALTDVGVTPVGKAQCWGLRAPRKGSLVREFHGEGLNSKSHTCVGYSLVNEWGGALWTVGAAGAETRGPPGGV